MKNLSTSQVCIAMRHNSIICILTSINNKKQVAAPFEKHLVFKSYDILVCLLSIFEKTSEIS